MEILKIILAAAFGIGGLIGAIIIIIDAFNDEIWKGFVCILCGLYMLYYSIFEFEHSDKWLIVLLAFGGGSIAAGILNLG